jgi:hypothetical protein
MPRNVEIRDVDDATPHARADAVDLSPAQGRSATRTVRRPIEGDVVDLVRDRCVGLVHDAEVIVYPRS